jgi:aminoglycoside phosphotransferase (APT) family kinase protein
VLKTVGANESPTPPDWTAILRREIAVYRELPHFAAWQPAFLGEFEENDWTALLIEDLSALQRVPPWTDAATEATARGLAAMHAATIGQPRPASRWCAKFTPFFQLIRERGDVRGDLPAEWHNTAEWWRWFDAASAAGEAALLDDAARQTPTRCFVHDDVRSDNLFLRGDQLVLIDWAHAAWGAPVIDSVCWSIGVELEGGMRAVEAHKRYEIHANYPAAHGIREALIFCVGYMLNGLQVATAPAHVQALRLAFLHPALEWYAQAFDLPAPPIPR